jgi:hypothetical protein
MGGLNAGARRPHLVALCDGQSSRPTDSLNTKLPTCVPNLRIFSIRSGVLGPTGGSTTGSIWRSTDFRRPFGKKGLARGG